MGFGRSFVLAGLLAFGCASGGSYFPEKSRSNELDFWNSLPPKVVYGRPESLGKNLMGGMEVLLKVDDGKFHCGGENGLHYFKSWEAFTEYYKEKFDGDSELVGVVYKKYDGECEIERLIIGGKKFYLMEN